jgi:hypothetical protein
MDTQNMQISIATIPGPAGRYERACMRDLGDLVEAFNDAAADPAFRRKTSTLLWSPTLFTDGGKNKGDIEGFSRLMVFDIDHGNVDLPAVEGLCGMSCVMHETHSSTPGDRKWRLVFELTAPPASTAAWEVTRRGLSVYLAELGIKTDPNANDPARGYYLPGNGVAILRNEGEAVPPDYVAEPTTTTQPEPPPGVSDGPRREVDLLGARDLLKVIVKRERTCQNDGHSEQRIRSYRFLNAIITGTSWAAPGGGGTNDTERDGLNAIAYHWLKLSATKLLTSESAQRACEATNATASTKYTCERLVANFEKAREGHLVSMERARKAREASEAATAKIVRNRGGVK